MATIPREFVDRYADALEKLSDEMKRRLVKDLERVDWTAPVAEIREALTPIMQAYCGASADSAATLAAEFYNGMSEQMTGVNPRAVLAPGYSDNAVEQFVRGAIQPLVDNGPSASSVVMNKMASRVGYEVKHAAGNTVIRNGVRDSRRVRFARVPRGSKSYPHGCPFCQMLASRGFAYRTAATAGEMNHYHDNCQCMVVPGFGANPKVEGYDPEEYLDRWQHPEKYADEGAEPQMSDDAIRYIDVADGLRKQFEKRESAALRRMERAYEFDSEALSGTGETTSKITAFYQGADVTYFQAKRFEAQEIALREAIDSMPTGDNAFFTDVMVDAAKRFASSTVTLPSEITGRSTALTPRVADMRSYFDKDGNPINFNARDGGYSSWKSSWGKAFADKEKKRRSRS